MTWTAVVGVCLALLGAGAFIDEYFVAESHKEWARAKLRAFHVGIDHEGQTAAELKDYAITPLFWSEKPFSRELFGDKYFWCGALIALFFSADVNERVLQAWLGGVPVGSNIPATFLFVIALVYSVVGYRYLVYRAQPDIRRFATNLILALAVWAGLSALTGGRPIEDGSGSFFLLVSFLGSTLAALFGALVMLGPVLYSRAARYTVSETLRAAANPSKSPYKFAAAGLSVAIALGKAVYDLLAST
jgi:hypothetical protein